MGWVPAAEYPWLREEYGFEWEGKVWFPEGATCRIARIRRGRWVPIPAEWRGKVPHPPTIRKRQSKYQGKKRAKKGGYIVKGDEQVPVQERRAPTKEDWDG